MKISEQWLRESVSPEASTEELAVRLTMAGREVVSVEPAGAAVQGGVSAEVRGVSPHPLRSDCLLNEKSPVSLSWHDEPGIK